jgi:hypothetical protein
VVANVVAVFGAAAAIAWASRCEKDDVVVEAAEFEPPLGAAVAVEVPAAGVVLAAGVVPAAGVVLAVWGTAEVEGAGEAAVAELVSDALVVGDSVDVLEGAVPVTEVRCTARDDVVAEAEEAELARAETECRPCLEPEELSELVELADLAAFDCFESVAFRVEPVLVCFDDEVLLWLVEVDSWVLESAWAIPLLPANEAQTPKVSALVPR